MLAVNEYLSFQEDEGLPGHWYVATVAHLWHAPTADPHLHSLVPQANCALHVFSVDTVVQHETAAKRAHSAPRGT